VQIVNNHLHQFTTHVPQSSFTNLFISPLLQFTWKSQWKQVSEFGQPLIVAYISEPSYDLYTAGFVTYWGPLETFPLCSVPFAARLSTLVVLWASAMRFCIVSIWSVLHFCLNQCFKHLYTSNNLTIFLKVSGQQKKREDGAKEELWPEPSCILLHWGFSGFQLPKQIHYIGIFWICTFLRLFLWLNLLMNCFKML